MKATCTVLNGLRHEVARVAVMTSLLRTSPAVLPSVPSPDRRPGSPGGMTLLGPGSRTNQVGCHSGELGHDGSPSGGRERGWEDRAHGRARRINVVSTNTPKGLQGLAHQGRWPGGDAPVSSPADGAPPANRESLTHPVVLVRTVVSPSLSRQGKCAGRRTAGEAGRGRGKKRRPSGPRVERRCASAPSLHAPAG